MKKCKINLDLKYVHSLRYGDVWLTMKRSKCRRYFSLDSLKKSVYGNVVLKTIFQWIVNVILKDFVSSWTWRDSWISARRSSCIGATRVMHWLFCLYYTSVFNDICNGTMKSTRNLMLFLCAEYLSCESQSRSLEIFRLTWSCFRYDFKKSIYVIWIFKWSDICRKIFDSKLKWKILLNCHLLSVLHVLYTRIDFYCYF